MITSRIFARTALGSLLSVLACCSLAGCDDEPSPPQGGPYDVERYDLRGEYDWERGRLAATVGVTLVPLDPELPGIVLDSAVAEVKSVRDDGGAALPFVVGEGQLTVDISSLRDRGAGEAIVLTIDYEATPGDWLRAVPARAGDPVGARAVYTFSEPLGAARWMPCHNRPDDRAIFSVEMNMDEGETMIANGDLVLDAADGGARRRMGYATQYPLPTYLMAFAISDFEVTGAQADELPIAVWRRRGVPGDHEGLLDELAREIDLFEGLLGPYPFEKYALVLLPDFSGGVEHAGITFQVETGTAQPSLAGDVSLTAHELGHQWYGDLVTVATWDDVWIKEGMATLLSQEAFRVHEDQSAAGTLSGDAWYVESGAAIRDTSLPPDEKYTSGPYDRAAWLFTQIRRVIGEDAFWGALRGILEEHRFGSVGTDELLAAFAPALGPDATARARRAIDAAALPTIEVAPSPSGGAFVMLFDPEEILVAPLEIEWRHEDGTASRQALTPEQPLELRREADGDLLVLDPDDAHPDLRMFVTDEESAASFGELVSPLRVPSSPAQVALLSGAAGAHQLAALYEGWPAPVGPDAFATFVASLDAESAKAVSIAAACGAADLEEDPAVRAEWVAALEAALSGPPPSLGLAYAGSYAACSELVPPLPLFPAEWAELVAGLTTASLPEDRVYFLSMLQLPHAEARNAWGNVARSGYSLRARSLAARQIRSYTRQITEVAPAEVPAWRALVVELLGASEASEVLRSVIPAASSLGGATAAENADLLDALGEVLRSLQTRRLHATAVCTALTLAAGDGDAWAAFVAGLDVDVLSARAQELVADPSGCQ